MLKNEKNFPVISGLSPNKSGQAGQNAQNGIFGLLVPVCGDTFRFVVINTNKAESLNKYYNTLIVNDFATFVKKPEIC